MSDTLGGSFKQVLKDITNKTLNETPIAIYDYCDEDDFKRLWKLGTDLQHIIIVWDGRGWSDEHNENLLAPHLTPMDWALAFSIEILGKKPEADISIHIVDLTGEEHDNEWAMQMRHQLLVEMPWVKLYAPLIPKDGKPVRLRQGYNPIDTLLEKHNSGSPKLNPSGETLKDAQTSDSRNRLIHLARQWSATLTQSKDHHDINNVIGPGFLGKKSRPVDGVRGAFHTRLLWCDLEITQVGINQWTPPSKRLFEKPLSVLIVDDHLINGWGEFICKSLGKGFNKPQHCNSGFEKISEADSDKMNIYGSTGPDPLIQFLEKAKFEDRDFTQQVMPFGENEEGISPEVILLDLRLPDLNKEKVKKLLTLLPEKTNKLAWPAIEKKEVEGIGDWCEGNFNDDQDADKALLLLPRLLAMALPLTPIILFSATGQTWIKETLKPYQNIFTGFEKPRVLSNPETVENSLVALQEGLNKAVNMMRLRLQLAHAQKGVKVAENGRCQNEIENCHIEIYADETGNVQQGIASGVAFCVFPSEGKADSLQERLENEKPSQDKGIGIIRCEGRAKVFKLKKANEAITNKVQTLVTLLNEVCITERQSWSVVWTKMPRIEENMDVSLDTFPDSPLDSALRFNLEFALFVLIPYFKSDFQGGVSVYLPTRDVSLSNQELPERLAKAFDLRVPRDNMIRTWPHGSGFPIIRGWLQEWGDGGSPIYNKIKKIKMTTLGDHKNDIWLDDNDNPRLFHGIADWVCSALPQLRNDLKSEGLFPCPNWFISEDEENTTEGGRILIQALKASVLRSDSGRDSDALRLILRNDYIAECQEELLTCESCSQQRLILWALRDELNHATGQSLHLLCAEA